MRSAIRGADAGLSRTYTLFLDGRPIAGVFGLIHKGQFLVILGGFDLAGYKKQSIGALVFEEIARDCIERGEITLDFTIGDEPYKRLFGARPTSYVDGDAVGQSARLDCEFPRRPAAMGEAHRETNVRGRGSSPQRLSRRHRQGALIHPARGLAPRACRLPEPA